MFPDFDGLAASSILLSLVEFAVVVMGKFGDGFVS